MNLNQTNKPIYISICTQKGGEGKSVFTTLVASYLHYAKGYHVAVIDCDYPQWSIYKLRQREAEQIERNSFYGNKAGNFFTKLGKPSYAIVPSQPETGLQQAEAFLAQEQEPYDVVLFDLPGTVNNEGVIKTLFEMDYLFTPVTTSRIVMESTLPFIISVNETIGMNSQIRLKNIFVFWNKVTGREKKELFLYYEKAILELGIPILKTPIPKSVRYDREQSIAGNSSLFLSTIFPADKALLSGSNLDLLVDEIIAIIE